MKGLVRTAFDDGVRPARPTVTKWRVESGRLEPEEVRVEWQYATGDALPWTVEAVPGALLAFTPEAIMWCAGHPRVRHRSGTAAVDEVLRQLVTQSAAQPSTRSAGCVVSGGMRKPPVTPTTPSRESAISEGDGLEARP
jgi:hypothetical protein